MTCENCIALRPVMVDDQWRRCCMLRSDNACLVKRQTPTPAATRALAIIERKGATDGHDLSVTF